MTTVTTGPTMTPYGKPDHYGDVADGGFEQRLIAGIRPIAEHFLASALHHFFDTGIYDTLLGEQDRISITELAGGLAMERERLSGLLFFLANEGVVDIEDDRVRLTSKGIAYGEFRPWYTMMIGGYSSTLGQLGAALRLGAPSCTREGRYVGRGSCEISRYDGIPMTRELIARAGARCDQVLDLGCGNALYLTEFCKEMSGVTAWGVEPDVGGYAEAVALVDSTAMADRISLVNRSATEFFADPPLGCVPDLVVFGYVLQEILEQEGEEAVVTLLQNVLKIFPKINIAVIEVANEVANPTVMRHGLATNFWNPYFLLHSFTEQRLETARYWEDLFGRAELSTAAFVSTDRNVDSSGLELGYLLRGPEWS